MYISDDLLKENYDLDTNTLKADYSSIECDSQARNGNIYDVIPSLKDSKYDKYIFIKDGKLKVDTNLSEPLFTYVSKNLGEDSKENLSLFKGGDGTQENPYVISNVKQWIDFDNDVNSGNDYENNYIILENDLDFSNVEIISIGNNEKKFLKAILMVKIISFQMLTYIEKLLLQEIIQRCLDI